MTYEIITTRRLERAIRNLSNPFTTENRDSEELDWTDEQIQDAYHQLSSLYGKKSILEVTNGDQRQSKEGIFEAVYTGIGFLHYRGRRPSMTLFSIEDLVIKEKQPIPVVETNALWNEWPCYGLDALDRRIQLYFAGVRKLK